MNNIPQYCIFYTGLEKDFFKIICKKAFFPGLQRSKLREARFFFNWIFLTIYQDDSSSYLITTCIVLELGTHDVKF